MLIPFYDTARGMYFFRYTRAGRGRERQCELQAVHIAASTLFLNSYFFSSSRNTRDFYIYGEGLVYSGIMRIISAFHQTSIVYIQ